MWVGDQYRVFLRVRKKLFLLPSSTFVRKLGFFSLLLQENLSGNGSPAKTRRMTEFVTQAKAKQGVRLRAS